MSHDSDSEPVPEIQTQQVNQAYIQELIRSDAQLAEQRRSKRAHVHETLTTTHGATPPDTQEIAHVEHEEE